MKRIMGTASKRRFEAFAVAAADPLFRAGYLMTGDASEAEDLVQETFIRVARRWPRVSAMDHPMAYARRILINLALDGAGRRSRRRAELAAPAGQPEVADESAARALQGIDDLAEFRWALARLPPRERAVLVLRYWADLPVAEVAANLGCSVGTVKSTASRGAARLAGILTRDGPPAGQPAPSYGAGMKAAASASGGCIAALLFRPYAPTTPVRQAFGGHLVQVGRYHGALFHVHIYFWAARHGHGAGHGGRAVKTTLTQLFVRLPAGHGMVRDLVIGSQDLSSQALIKIVANGLSS